MSRRRYTKPRYRRPRKGTVQSQANKAKSLQTSFRQATDRTDSLSIDAARALVANPPSCPYCEQPIPYREVSIDHMQPRSRGGPDVKENLVWCCRTCNLTKGALTVQEFKALLAFLNEWPEMKDNVLTRLRAGGARFGRRRRGR